MIRNRQLAYFLPVILFLAFISTGAVAQETQSDQTQDGASSSAKRGITSYTQRFKKAQEQKQESSYIQMAEDYVNTSGVTELEVGAEPSAEQLKNLKEDMVWIKKEEIGGFTILYPVVYLAEEANETDSPEAEK